ncbi:hypothetical protein O9K51_11172 [Purpureocillium lavendulum]|uniref:Methyltransferase n=1 Tax=Purpureocillium lavendulum TaxID=1247861 RepID=A0AB34FBN3_9HYPO|nr:hypothetical protein O9K51_11172 [Purpureocillium lavendulum]
MPVKPGNLAELALPFVSAIKTYDDTMIDIYICKSGTLSPRGPKSNTNEDTDGADSAIDDDGSVLPSTASLSESLFDYRDIHGRTFQNSKTTQYWGPNDDKQNNGLDIAHHFMTMLKNDQLFEAPISRPSKVLDVGTGTGIWAIDMADSFPSAEVIGTDISPIQPTWVPPNCVFHIDDAQLEWTYRPGSFDFVHIRALYGSISDWHQLYRQAYWALEPGGWIENTEISIDLQSDAAEIKGDPDHIFRRWAKVLWEGADCVNRTMRIANNGTMRRLMVDAGFVNVKERSYQVPVGAWSCNPKMKLIGTYNLAFMDESLEGFALFILKEIMGWEYAKLQIFIMEMRRAIRNPRIRPYYQLINVYGQKPEVQP